MSKIQVSQASECWCMDGVPKHLTGFLITVWHAREKKDARLGCATADKQGGLVCFSGFTGPPTSFGVLSGEASEAWDGACG